MKFKSVFFLFFLLSTITSFTLDIAGSSTIQTEEYPLRRPLNIVTLGTPDRTERKFINFILSKAGQEIIETESFIRIQ